MSDRIQRFEFLSLYELYLQKNEEFKQAVRDNRDPAEINKLRENIQEIYGRLREARSPEESSNPGEARPPDGHKKPRS